MMAYYTDDHGQLIKHAIIGISDGDENDAAGVLGFEDKLISILREKKGNTRVRHEFTDGCGAQ
jgi:hypothetical protein